MAATDMNAVVHIKDANGNVNNIFPATKIANVDGLQSALNAKADSTTVTNQLSGKVDKVTGKGLSTNDYTTAEKNKLSGIADGATANIGTVTSVKVGDTAYNPSSGVVSLPAYPTDTNTHRPIQMNGTEILGNNTTALNLKAGSNVSLSNSNGTVTIAATDTTYSPATTSANGLMSSTDKAKLDNVDPILQSIIDDGTKNLLNMSDFAHRNGVALSNNVWTMNNADTKSSIDFQVQKALNSVTGGYILYQTYNTDGWRNVSFTKDSSFNLLIIGHNGSSVNGKVTYDVSNLIDGVDYTLKFNITAASPSSKKFAFGYLMITPTVKYNVAPDYKDYTMTVAELTKKVLELEAGLST